MIPAEAVEAAALAIARIETGDDGETFANDIDRIHARAALTAAAPHILESAAHDLAGADKTSHWDDMYQKLEEQDGGDLSSESTAYLNGIADAMRFLQARADPEAYHKGYEAGYNKACEDIIGIKPTSPAMLRPTP